MFNETRGSEQGGMESGDESGSEEREIAGAPAGARQNVRVNAAEQGAVARPGGATQNSGGALASNDDEMGHGPGRGAD
jgi:hypothetical protein